MLQQEESKKKGSSSLKRWLGYSLAILLAGGAFVSGLYIGQTGGMFGHQVAFLSFWERDSSVEGRDVDLSEFWRVWDLLEEKFVTASTTDQVSNEERVQG
ncbi:MAG TPA: hypothetical protein VGE31_01980, partial [Candidatus Paceibacterota bacterium]